MSYQHVAIYLRNQAFFSFLIKTPHQKKLYIDTIFQALTPQCLFVMQYK